MADFLYDEIYRKLTLEIEQGIYPPGSLFPSEKALCVMHGVSMITVRKALSMLEEKGIIQKIKGKGSVVNENVRVSSPSQKNIVVLDILFPAQMNPGYPEKEFPAGAVCNQNSWKNIIYSSLHNELRRDYNVMLTCHTKEAVINSFDSTILYSVDRVFVIGYYDKELIDFLHSKGKLVMVFNNYNKEVSVCSVSNNDRQAFYDATQYLYDQGHRRIAAINGDTLFSESVERAMGYQECLMNNHMTLYGSLIKWGNMTFESGYWLMREIWGVDKNITAVVCVNDNVAAGAIYAIKELGLSCPGDISVFGHDNNEDVRDKLNLSLATIDPNYNQIGKEIAARIIRPIWVDDNITVDSIIVMGSSVHAIEND